MKKVAVVIMNWNGRKLMQMFLPSVVKYTESNTADVIVADNGSTDGSAEWLESEFPSVVRLLFDKNHGFAGGYNLAVEKLDGYKYILLLNSDVEVTANWLAPMLDVMENDTDIAACQPKIKAYADKGRFEYAGAAGGYLDRNGFPFCRGRIFDTVERDEGQYDGEVKQVFWASGAAMLVRRKDYLEAGGLDTDFFAHMEEIDLCWRLNLLGKKVCIVPQSTVYHVGGGTLAAGNPRKTYLNFRNNLFMLYKNLPLREGRSIILRRKLLDGTAAAMFAAKLDFANVGAVWRAHRDFEKGKCRYSCQPERNIMNVLPESRRNIVTDYYLKGKRVF